MIIIEQNAEKKLFKDVYAYQNESIIYRGIFLQLSLIAPERELVDKAIHMIKDFFPDQSGTIYMCENYDLVMISAHTHRRDIAKFITQLSSTLFPDILEKKYVTLYETDSNWNELNVICKQKYAVIKAREDAIAADKKKQEEMAARQKILDLKIHDEHVSTIAARRKKREHPEILIVEDDPFTQRLVNLTIQKKAKTVTARNGYEAITYYASKAPDVLFLDIGLPDITGHDVLKKILEMDPDAYIVMLSANGDKDNVLKAVEHGAKGFVGKPFTEDKIFQYIEKSPHYLAKKNQ